MSSMLFRIDENSAFWNAWTQYKDVDNKATFAYTVKTLENLYENRVRLGDVLDLNEILRTFFITPDISCYGWFVLKNRFSEDTSPFIKLIHMDDKQIIFEVTDLRRD